HQLSKRHVTIMVCVRTARIFSQTYSLQHHGRMASDGARPRIRCLAFAVELYEGADQDRVFAPRTAIVALERGLILGGDITSTGRQFRLHRVAEVLSALLSVCEIRVAGQIKAAAVTRWNCAKRPVGFADDVKPSPQPTGARGIHGEVTGILDRAFAQFLQVKRSRPLQN